MSKLAWVRKPRKTKKEAIKNIKEAISCYIHALEEDNFPVPKEKFEVSVVVV